MTSRVQLPKTRCFRLASFVLLLPFIVFHGRADDDRSLGVITSAGSLVINGHSAATGTTLFAGDSIEAREGAALIRFHGGGRVELVKAKATIKREGRELIIHCHAGLIRFSIQGQSDTRILAGRFQLDVSDPESIGGLALNQNGQLAVTLCSGKLLASDETEKYEITPEKSLLIMRQTGLGNLSTGGDTLFDGTKSWWRDDLKGKTVRIGNETHEILRNSENTLTIDGAWKRPTGWHPYEIRYPSNAPLPPEIPIDCMTPESLTRIAPAAAGVVGAGAGTAVGFLVGSKSESSRSPAVPPQ